MRKILLLSSVILSILISMPSVGQVGKGGKPRSFALTHLNTGSAVPEIAFMGVDEAALLKEDEKNKEDGTPYRFGVPFYVNSTLANAGKWNVLPNGDRLWRYTVKSKGAYSINLIFDQYKLPAGAELFIYNADKSMVIGAFTSENNQDDGKFGVQPVKGEEVTIEYYEPLAVKGRGVLGISEVIHAYRNLFDEAYGYSNSSSCQINVNCPLGASWQNQKKAVALIVAGGALCSGAMVNNTANDGTPYLLTANHCFSGSVSTWVYVFNYESPTCTSVEGPSNQTVSGSSLVSKNADSDFLLVKLNSLPPSSYNVHYAGWTKSTAAPTSATGIHHPAGDIKKISNVTSTLLTSDWNGSGIQNHWEMLSWTNGTTEGGSSGSPLFDQNGRIVGQLHGGTTPACPGTGKTSLYGKFDASWNAGTTSSDRLKDWLDPSNSGVTTLNGADLSSLLAYCSSAATSTGGGLISEVDFGTIANNSGTACAIYSDFTAKSTNVLPGASVPLSITTGNCGINNTRFVKVFIDWNGDFDFNDFGELVATSAAINSTTPFTANVSVPTSVVTGTNVRMRVVCKDTTTAAQVFACGSYSKGETEDYTINITGGTSYSIPVSGNTNVTTCSGVLYDDGGATGNYSDNDNGSITINPSVVGNKVSLTFTSFSIEECCELFYIYDGVNTSAPLLGLYTTNPGTVYATNVSGALTVLFVSDGSVNYSGFQANIACVSTLPQPDLITKNQAATPTIVSASSSISLSCDVYNQGGTTAASSNVGYYLSTNNTWDAADVYLGNSSGTSLANANTGNKTAILTIPAGTTIGNYYILYYADYLNAVTESDETNNVTSFQISVVAPTIDLIIQSPSANPLTLLSGSSITLTCSILNQGSTASNSSNIGYYLSSNATWDASDTYLGATTGASLGNGISSPTGALAIIPNGTVAGNYYILYFADYSGLVSETDETNNVASVAVTVTTPFIDLIVQTPTLGATSVAYGSSILVTDYIYNQGTSTSYYNYTGYYLSTDNVWDAADVFLNALYTYSISPSASSYNSVSIAIPSSTVAGSYYILFYADYTNTVSESNETNNVSSVPITVVAPSIDLIIQTPVLGSTSAAPGSTLSLSNYVYNQGNTYVSYCSTGYYLSSNATWDASDVYLGYSYNYGIYGGGSSYNSNTLSIPTGTTIGNYYILFYADYNNYITETNETNNVSSLAITIVSPTIDLIIQTPTVSNTSVPVGGSLSVTDYIYNQGNSVASSSNVGYYLSTDNVWDASDLYLNYSYGYSLSSSLSSYRSATLTIPGTTTTGSYYILYYADYLNNVTETNETNNVSSMSITVVSPTVDLIIQTPALSTTSIAIGATVSASNYIYNQGNSPASTYSTGYYLSTNNTWDAADVYLGNFWSGYSLSGASSAYEYASITIPSNTTTGSYYILFYADYLNSIAETNETNNINSLAVTVVNPTIDLIMQTAYLSSSSVAAGNTISASAYIYNQGNFTALSSNVGYYLSTDNVWDASDTYLNYSSGSSLAAITSSYRNTSITIPASTTPGNYYILYYADYQNNVTETNEANNVVSTALTVIAPTVDFIIQYPSASPSVSFVGSSINLSCYIYNQGNAPSSSSDVGYYLSTNNTWDAADTYLTSSAGSSVGASSYGTRSAVVSVPTGTTPGNYYILFYADYLNSVTETNETNNVNYQAITVASGIIVPYSGSNSITACSGTVYDNGGNSNYQTNSNGTLTINPGVTGNYISLNFGSFQTEYGYDYLRIYDGTSTSAALIGSYSGYASPGTISATNASGALTLSFYSDGSNSYSGFDAAISCLTTLPKSDLIIQTPTITPISVIQGGNVIMNAYIKNQGTSNSFDSNIGYYLSTDNIWDASDTFLTYSTGSALSSGTSSYRSYISATIPASTTLGSYYILFYADYTNNSSESDETNNVSAVALTVTAATIDLLIQTPTLSSTSIPAGNTLSATCYIYNSGNSYASSSDVGYYLSADNIWDASDVYLYNAGRSYYGLNASSSNYVNSTFTIPSTTVAGNYYILFYADYQNLVTETNETNNVNSIALTVVAPTIDLIIQSPVLPSTALVVGNYTSVSCSLSNLGNSYAPACNIGFYLSTDNALDASDVLLTYTSSWYGTTPGYPNPVSTYFTVPAGTVAGNYYVLFQADYSNSITETNETNNVSALAVTVAAATIDLIIQTPTLSNSSVAYGNTISVSSFIYNQGNTFSSTSNVGYYLSTDNIWDAADIYLGYTSGYGIYAGYSNNMTASLTIPTGTTIGSYYVLFYADYLNGVVETNETNNVNSAAITITAPSIDLIIQTPSLGGVTSAPAGTFVSATCYVYNQGTTFAASSNVGYYLSTDNIWDAADTFIGYSYTYSLSGSTSTSSGTGLTIPTGTTAGNYYVLFKADYSNSITETDETNNVSALSLTVVTAITDLIIQTPTLAYTSVVSGNSVNSTCYLYNQGNTYISYGYVGYYLSSDNVWDASDVYLNYSVNYGLYSGTSSYNSTSLTIPSTTTAGNYYILFYADYQNSVIETNETNNLSSVAIAVTAPNVDLIIQSPALGATSVAQSGSLYASNYTYNQGTSYASYNYTGYYLSTNTTWDASDVYLSSAYNYGISSGNSSYDYSTLTIPAGTTAGNYYILFYADYNNSITESNETNNVSSVAITVTTAPVSTVDLIIQSPAVSSTSLYQGSYVSVSCTTYNQGTSLSAYNYTGFYLSTNTTWDASDVFLGNIYNYSLSASGSYYNNTYVTIPSGISGGNYYILFYADAYNNVTESNESNNVASVAINIGGASADLVVKTPAIVGRVAVGVVGGNVIVNSSVYNQGTYAASSSYLGYYLSTNSTWDASDIFLTSSSVYTLAAGGSAFNNVALTMPHNITSGNYYIIFYADYKNDAAESDETNNTYALSISLTTEIDVAIDVNSNISVYPNPTVGKFIVTIDKVLSPCKITVFNTIGEEVVIRNIAPSGNGITEDFQLENLAAGLYTVKIEMDGNAYFKKVSVEK